MCSYQIVEVEFVQCWWLNSVSLSENLFDTFY